MQYAPPIAQAEEKIRMNFIKKTYLHVAFAILGFTLIEFILFKTGIAHIITKFIVQVSWLLVLGLFMGISWVADRLARKPNASLGMQYSGLILYTVAEAFIFTPMLYMATSYLNDPSILQNAAYLTMAMFCGLSAFAFYSGTDFSFLRGVLITGGFVALGVIIIGSIFGFTLGLWFSMAMIIFACGSILFDTSNIIHYYQENQYVAASISLFASVALLFWYILQIFISRD